MDDRIQLPRISSSRADHRRLMQFLASCGNGFWLLTGILLVATLGFVDYLTGAEIAFSFFYLLPISLLSWFSKRRFAVAMAILSAITWAWADIATGNAFSHPAILYWNTCVQLAFFLVTSLLLSKLRAALHHEQALARTDLLTGAANHRFFLEFAQAEMERCARYAHPFTVGYLDLDDFKAVNDSHGHSAGDELLRAVVRSAGTQLRKTDLVARMGGDEFAVLLPETGEEPARAAFEKIRRSLLEEMKRNEWPVTFSIGVLTCRQPPQSLDGLLNLADRLMYSVKQNGKNGVAYAVYPPESRAAASTI